MADKNVYKLHYFNRKGRTEVSRLILAHAGVAYEDVRIERDQWPALKSTFPNGQVPVLEFQGRMLTESAAIARFLARRHGLVGRDDFEAALIDAAVDTMSDLYPAVATMKKAGPSEKVEAEATFIEKALKPMLAKIEKWITDNGTGFLVGHQLTWADLNLFQLCDFTDWLVGAGQIDQWPKLSALRRRVAETPAIAEWIRRRPESPF